jgi:Mg2+-importing ATPase
MAGSPTDSVLSYFESTYGGLTESESTNRLAVVGKNVLSTSKPLSWWMLLLLTIPNPFNALLSVIAIISIAAPPPSWPTFGLIVIMILLSVAVRFWQEYKGNHEAIKLQSKITRKIPVRHLRDETGKPAW